MVQHDAIVKEFLQESLESIAQLEARILDLEDPSAGASSVDAIFRSVHSIKGVANHLEYLHLGALAHAGESLLSDLRDQRRVADVEVVDALLALVDGLRARLQTIAESGVDAGQDLGGLIHRLKDLRVPSGDETWAPVPQAEGPPDAQAPEPLSPEDVSPEAGEPASERTIATRVRVDVEVLTSVMNLVGELVLARNRLRQVSLRLGNDTMLDGVGRLDRITTELQDAVMSTRMQPVGTLWDRLPRMVRTAARTTGKQVRVHLEGGDTELDRTLIEAITDPLSHMVRNAVVHGLELPEERMRWGKPAEGTIALSAHHESGQVVIELRDDGGGLPVDSIRRRAVERGIWTEDKARTASDEQVWYLIFSPGFSTADQVTELAGRGVGMDVVRTHVEHIGGSVDVHSESGEGTTFRIRIPLTLAIISALVITCDGERFALPQDALKKLLVVRRSEAQEQLEDFHGVQVMRFEGGLLPIVCLDEVLQLDCSDDQDEEEQGDLFIIVVEARGRRYGLVADAIEDTQEIVVKSLDPLLRNLGLYTGATTLGDGSIALILDVMGLARAADIVATSDAIGLAMAAAEPAAEVAEEALLLTEVGGRRIAIPVAQIQRLEVIPAEQLEWGGSQHVVQFERDLLPMFSLAELLGLDGGGDWAGALQVVIARCGPHRVGLVVDEILDITHQAVDLKREGGGAGLRGSTVLDGRVTDLVDLALLLRGPVFKADPVSA